MKKVQDHYFHLAKKLVMSKKFTKTSKYLFIIIKVTEIISSIIVKCSKPCTWGDIKILPF